MDVKITELSEYPKAQGFWTVGVQDGVTKKYNLGDLETSVENLVAACGIEDFSTTKIYAAGDFCYYSGYAYKFTTAHTGAWSSSDVTQTTALAEIQNYIEIENKQETTIIVNSDDSSFDYTQVTVSISVSGETNPRTSTLTASTDTTPVYSAVFQIPRDKSYSVSVNDITGYTHTSTINTSSLGSAANLYIKYYKIIEKENKTLTATATVSGTLSSLDDINGNEIAFFNSNIEWSNINITSGSASWTYENPTDSTLSYTGTVVYPLVSGYVFATGDSNIIDFVGTDTSTTLNYISEMDSYTSTTYIKGAGSQYINTGYTLTSNNVEIEMKFLIEAAQTNKYFFGAEESTTTSPKYSILLCNYGTYAGNQAYLHPLTNVIVLNEILTYKVTYDGATLTVTLTKDSDSSVLLNKSTSMTDSLNKTYPLYLFGDNKDNAVYGYCSTMTLYNFKITDNGTLVRNFVPYKMVSGYGCLKDTINNKFYFNKGTGNFSVPVEETNTAN